jgi:hypothetical protein
MRQIFSNILFDVYLIVYISFFYAIFNNILFFVGKFWLDILWRLNVTFTLLPNNTKNTYEGSYANNPIILAYIYKAFMKGDKTHSIPITKCHVVELYPNKNKQQNKAKSTNLLIDSCFLPVFC